MSTKAFWNLILITFFVVEVLIWWRLSWNPLVLLYGFICAQRGSCMIHKRNALEKEQMP